MEGPLRLPLREIPHGTSTYAVELAAADLDLLMADAEFVTPVTLELEVIRVDEQVQFRGQAQVVTRQGCARCLEPMERTLVVPVEVVARRRGAREKDQEPAEGLVLHDGEEISLADEVRELILLSIPRAPLCRPDCAGLCPQCGANLTGRPCGCGQTDPSDPRWAGLRGLSEDPGAAPGHKGKRSPRGF
jgi:uncharacterized protein